MKGSTLSSIMMRCPLQPMRNTGGFGWLKGNSHSKRRGMDALFMSQTSFWRPQGISVSHRCSMGLKLNSRSATAFKRQMQEQLFTQAKMPMPGGIWHSCSCRSKMPSQFLNTCTQELLAYVFDCSLAHEALTNDALNIKNMNIKASGKQCPLHPTIIPVNNPLPKPGKCDTHGDIQDFSYPTDHSNA